MDTEQMKQQCLERLRVVYPEPWFVWWGIGAGVHCEEAIALVRPHGERGGCASVSDSLPISELLAQLMDAPIVDSEASLAQSGNYVADDAVQPKAVWFANGRYVRLVRIDGQESYLAVGTDFRTKDELFF